MSKTSFGEYLRKVREARRRTDSSFSVRGFAAKVGVAACYISKVELGQVGPPSETTIRRIAEELGESPDVMLAMAGKISSDLREVIVQRPLLFAELIRRLRDQPDDGVRHVVREAGAPYGRSGESGQER